MRRMPQVKMSGTYRTREFSELAGVTVRTLHHYDRLGLLTPPRTHTGYRVYGEKDLETLEQIVALKFIGLPLSKIKTLLRRNPVQLGDAWRTGEGNSRTRRTRELGDDPALHASQSGRDGGCDSIAGRNL